MGLLQHYLNVIFRRVPPEVIYRDIHNANDLLAPPSLISHNDIHLDILRRFSSFEFNLFSLEELSNLRNYMFERMAHDADIMTHEKSIFLLLVQMAKKALRQSGNELYCSYNKVLAWRNVHLPLGQDLFTTAFFAFEDIKIGKRRRDFTWDAVLKTDNAVLRNVLDQGISENHCHLYGTSQTFSITWACMMNYLDSHEDVLRHLNVRNLQASLSRGASDNVWPWEQRILWACYLRLKLFEELLAIRLSNKPSLDIEGMEANCLAPAFEIRRGLQQNQFLYGAKIKQSDGEPFVLDYALTQQLVFNGVQNEDNRLLAGERSFLYECFKACFDGSFTRKNQDWFFLYLVIKTHFRNELILANQECGFRNFQDFQDRKAMAFLKHPQYKAELVRLAVNAHLHTQQIESFELRVGPGETAKSTAAHIESIDKHIASAQSDPKEPVDPRTFYVLHFYKHPDDPLPPDYQQIFIPVRNAAVREKSRQNARALAEIMLSSPHVAQRICGIDAASIEIGCRPEVFAPEFRYLLHLTDPEKKYPLFQETSNPHLQLTFHAGEDFLDVADGLRAIDEALLFLQMERGSRIGHAMALGVEPQLHYLKKSHRILLPKQDLLDNLVWLLYRANELNVSIDADLRESMRTQAETYYDELYGKHMPRRRGKSGLRFYFQAWKLRGDDPTLYHARGSFQRPTEWFYHPYPQWLCTNEETLQLYRENAEVVCLYHLYHHNADVRLEGQKIEVWKITPKYIKFIRDMQDALQIQISDRGIMIECNPSSNVLIGTFDRYDQHPLFRFNNRGLSCDDGSTQMNISINTDDLGVFDTSLENEYALIAHSMERMTKENDKKTYSSETIYDYLDKVRRMGNTQSFRKGSAISQRNVVEAPSRIALLEGLTV